MDKKINFDDSMKRLQYISDELSKDDIPMEKALVYFEEGLKLANECQSLLKSYEEKVQTLIKEYKEVENEI